MKFKDALKLLEKDKKFKDWQKNNENFFLSNTFIMIEDSDEINKIQIGYCNKKEDKITSFIVEKNRIEQFSDKIFKEPNTKVSKIDIKNINVDVIDALDEANKAQKK